MSILEFLKYSISSLCNIDLSGRNGKRETIDPFYFKKWTVYLLHSSLFSKKLKSMISSENRSFRFIF
jgi:hypothetical protein